ncbi:MAG: hypothetical protein JKY44_05865 [Flavobacteriaceae bacterium]|nr:hypothetical protein [Flavobacteriaceae bacterium]
MNEYINQTFKILSETKSVESVNKYFEKNKLSVKDRLLIIKEVMDVNTDQAFDIVLHKYRGKFSDDILEMFLNNKENN